MKSIIVIAVTAASLAVAGAAQAKPPAQPEPTHATTTTVVSGPTPVSPLTVPGGGLGAAGCAYQCFVECWTGQTRSGVSDWSGWALVKQSVEWCGDGYNLTYTSGSQDYDQGGFYHITSTAFLGWTGGCWGCGSRTLSGYIFWDWNPPPWMWLYSQSGTSHLDTTVYAWGGIST